MEDAGAEAGAGAGGVGTGDVELAVGVAVDAGDERGGMADAAVGFDVAAERVFGESGGHAGSLSVRRVKQRRIRRFWLRQNDGERGLNRKGRTGVRPSFSLLFNCISGVKPELRLFSCLTGLDCVGWDAFAQAAEGSGFSGGFGVEVVCFVGENIFSGGG